MAMENLLDKDEVSRRELAATDYQIIREVEKLLPRLKQLLDDGGTDTSDIDLTKIDDKRRGDARARIASARARKR